jgi:hypothetical protein
MSKHICDEEFPWCTEASKAGEFYKLRVSDLSPTQFATGKVEVQVKAKRMKKKYKKDPQLLHDYLRVRPVPIVVREKKFYLVDHHHLVRALYEALYRELKNNICVYVRVMENWTGLIPVHFWKEMFKMHWIYLFDHKGGGPQQPERLPKHVKDMEFDPYRSLAWIVRYHHGYLKSDVPFSEFKWANFFRTRILLDQDILAGRHTFDDLAFNVDKHGELMLTYEGKEVIDDALFLAASAEARGLPGFRGTMF